jgi:cytochrome c
MDEEYSFQGTPSGDPRGRTGVTILATLDEKSYSPGSSFIMGDHPIAWVSTAVGRMFYLGLGHTLQEISNPDFKTMLRNAILWAAGPATAIHGQSILHSAADNMMSQDLKINNSSIVLDIQRSGRVSLVLIDPAGKIVAAAWGTNGACRIEKSAFGAGVYFIHGAFQGGTFTKRIVQGR